jgi:DNA mismatch endonuclease (patch repair protein)
MSRIRSKNTKPEVLLRRALRDAGLVGYRLHWGPYHIDVAWPGLRVAVFVDGAFWHGKLGKTPKTNPEFWKAKFARNKARDEEATRALRRDGWVVIRYWDTDKKIPIGRIRRAVSTRRRSSC